MDLSTYQVYIHSYVLRGAYILIHQVVEDYPSFRILIGFPASISKHWASEEIVLILLCPVLSFSAQKNVMVQVYALCSAITLTSVIARLLM